MYRILIVEDTPAEADVLRAHLERYAAEKGLSFSIEILTSALEFINSRHTADLVFMDIHMPGINGMDTAMELRRLDKTVSIIFITNLVQYAQKGYEVDAVGFLVKPVNYYDFSMKFQKALDIYVMNEDRAITLDLPGGMCRISTDKLMYVEIINHRLYYHLVDEVIEMTGVLSNVERDLAAYGFLRCNKCYLVNPKFIVNVKGSDVEVGNRTLQISRPRRAAFLAELADWYAGAKRRDP